MTHKTTLLRTDGFVRNIHSRNPFDVIRADVVLARMEKRAGKTCGAYYEIYDGHCCKVSDEAAFCLIQRPYISKTLLTRRISPRGSP